MKLKSSILQLLLILTVSQLSYSQTPTIRETEEWIAEKLGDYTNFETSINQNDMFGEPWRSVTDKYVGAIFFSKDSLSVITGRQIKIRVHNSNKEPYIENTYRKYIIPVKDIKKVELTRVDYDQNKFYYDCVITTWARDYVNNVRNLESEDEGSFLNYDLFSISNWKEVRPSIGAFIRFNEEIEDNNLLIRLQEAFKHLVESSGGKYYKEPFYPGLCIRKALIMI